MFSLFIFQEELEPHERCIRKILEQKGRVVEIVYRLEDGEDISEAFDYIDEIGCEALSASETGLFEDDETPESALRQRVRSAWVRIQLGNGKKEKITNLRERVEQ